VLFAKPPRFARLTHPPSPEQDWLETAVEEREEGLYGAVPRLFFRGPVAYEVGLSADLVARPAHTPAAAPVPFGRVQWNSVGRVRFFEFARRTCGAISSSLAQGSAT